MRELIGDVCKTDDVANQLSTEDHAKTLCILIEFREPRFIAV